MLKRLALLITLTLVLLLPVPSAAQEPPEPEHSDPDWRALYWDNPNLDGAPVISTTELNLNHNWGIEAPYEGLPPDGFSARWTRYVDFAAGTYRFIATSDDGMRVWVDGTLILDAWHDRAATTDYVDHYLSAGHHMVRVDYYENTGFAVAQLSWIKAADAVGRWRAEYYNNMTLSGEPALVRKEAAINFDWAVSSPAVETIATDHFSARWTRTMDFPADMYTFELIVDDGARLWVNGHLLIDAWYDQAATRYTGDIYLSGGPVSLELQYYENTGFAQAELSWDPPVNEVPGTEAVIVDNRDAGFTTGGSAGGWHYVAEGYADQLLWTYNNDQARTGYNWARWYPDLAPGTYEVFVYVPFRYTTTSQARYWVSHAEGLTLRVVDQSANGDAWVSLGSYRLRGDGSDYVSLADVTFEAQQSRLVAFDAVKWEPRQ